MTNKEKWAIEVLRKGYPDINRYATSELGIYDSKVADFDEALDIVIKALKVFNTIVSITDDSENLISDRYGVIIVEGYADVFTEIKKVIDEYKNGGGE